MHETHAHEFASPRARASAHERERESLGSMERGRSSMDQPLGVSASDEASSALSEAFAQTRDLAGERSALAAAIRDAASAYARGEGREGGERGGGEDEDEDASERERALDQGRLAIALSAAERGTPMAALFLMIFAYKYFYALACVGWLAYATARTTQVLTSSVSAREERKLREVMVWMSVALGHAMIIWWALPAGRRARALLRGRTATTGGGFLESLWDVLVLDCGARFLFIVLKLAVVALPLSTLQKMLRHGSRSGATSPKAPAKISPARAYRRRAALLSAIEYGSLTCRSFVPVPVWLAYFQRELPSLLASFVAGLYLVAKARGVVRRSVDFGKAISISAAFGKRASAHGELATREDLMESGDVCAICQEKCVDAVKLRCSHIFCDDCIGEWFDRQPTRGTAGSRTCPTCRSVVQSGAQRSYGDGATSFMPILF